MLLKINDVENLIIKSGLKPRLRAPCGSSFSDECDQQETKRKTAKTRKKLANVPMNHKDLISAASWLSFCVNYVLIRALLPVYAPLSDTLYHSF